jgi:hypothetical protein
VTAPVHSCVPLGRGPAPAWVDDVLAGGRAAGADGERLALRVRAAASAERVVVRAEHALGPAPLTLDERHARRAADLTVYLHPHRAERDVAAPGRSLVGSGPPW